MAQTIEELVVKLSADNAELHAGLKKTQEELSALRATAAETGKSVKEATTLLKADVLLNFGKAALGAAEGLLSFVEAGAQAASHAKDLADSLGISVTQVSRLTGAAGQMGSSAEAMETGLRKLSLSMGEATEKGSPAALAFQKLGVNIRDSAGNIKPVSRVLLEVADGFKRLTSATDGNRISRELLGKGGQELIPTLKQGSEAIVEQGDELERLSLIMTDRIAVGADKFQDTLELLKSSTTTFAASIASDLAPGLVILAKRFLEVAGAADQLKGKSGFAEFADKQASDTVATWDGLLGKLKEIKQGLADFAEGAGTGNLSKLGKGLGGILSADGAKEFADSQKKAIEEIAQERETLDKEAEQRAKAIADKGTGIDLKKQFEEAKSAGERLSKFIDGLMAQISGLSSGAKEDEGSKIIGRLNVGDLGKDIDKAFAGNADRARGARAEIIHYVTALRDAQEVARKQLEEEKGRLEERKRLDDQQQKIDDSRASRVADIAKASQAAFDEARPAAARFAAVQSDVNEAVKLGGVTQEQATFLLKKSAREMGLSFGDMDLDAENAATGIKEAFGESLFAAFDKGADGMVQSFSAALGKMLQQAAVNNIVKALFGGADDKGLGGLFGSFFKGAKTALFGGGKASGGPVMQGRQYLVGENGPEMFTPDLTGNITPAPETAAMVNGQSAGPGQLQVVLTDRALDRTMRDWLEDALADAMAGR